MRILEHYHADIRLRKAANFYQSRSEEVSTIRRNRRYHCAVPVAPECYSFDPPKNFGRMRYGLDKGTDNVAVALRRFEESDANDTSRRRDATHVVVIEVSRCIANATQSSVRDKRRRT